jgi:hypothetical protein
VKVAPRRPAYLTRLAVAGPLVLAAFLLVVLVRADPVSRFGATSSEGALSFERVTLAPGVIRVQMRNDGTAPVTIAQVSVNDAFWRFTAARHTLGRLGTTTVTVHYPWEVDRPLHLAVLTSSGASSEHDVAAAALTPALGGRSLGDYAWLGVILGVIPVGLGLLLLPALRRVPPDWMRFLLALGIGLLAVVVVETVREGLDQAHQAPAALHGVELFVVGLMVVTAAMAWLGRLVRQVPVGASAALPPVRHLAALILVAGGPAVLGAWAGASMATPTAAALAFGVATGAVAAVVWGVGHTLVGQERGSPATVAAGFVVGVVAMYAVAVLAA